MGTLIKNCRHEYVKDVMLEEGVKYAINHCVKCGDWR